MARTRKDAPVSRRSRTNVLHLCACDWCHSGRKHSTLRRAGAVSHRRFREILRPFILESKMADAPESPSPTDVYWKGFSDGTLGRKPDALHWFAQEYFHGYHSATFEY